MTVTSSTEYAGSAELPFLIELTKNVILAGLQKQVRTSIDPASLAYDMEGFVWENGHIVMDLTFRDGEGFAKGRVYLQPSVNAGLDLCFLVDAKFLEHLPRSLNMHQV